MFNVFDVSCASYLEARGYDIAKYDMVKTFQEAKNFTIFSIKKNLLKKVFRVSIIDCKQWWNYYSSQTCLIIESKQEV